MNVDLLVSTPGIAEAPCWAAGELWFTDLTLGVRRVRRTGEVETVVPDRRGVGGLVPHIRGGVVASGRSLVHVAEDATVTELLARPEGTTGFNDLHTSREGDVLAGVLHYRPLAGEAPEPGALLQIGAGGPQELAAGPAWPNGIATAPDGSTVYLADFATGDVLVLTGGGQLEVLATLAEGHADGLAVDTEGLIWVATGPGGSLVALTPRGRVERRLHAPASFVASLALPPEAGPAVVAVAGLADGAGGLLLAGLDVVGMPITMATLPLP